MKFIPALAVLLITMASAQAATPAADCKQAGSVVAKVDGMVCDFCAQSVKKAILENKDVADVAIDLTKKEVAVKARQGATIDPAFVAKKIDWAGYKLVSMQPECSKPVVK